MGDVVRLGKQGSEVCGCYVLKLLGGCYAMLW